MYHIADVLSSQIFVVTGNKRFRIDRSSEVVVVRSGRVRDREVALNRDGWPIAGHPRYTSTSEVTANFLAPYIGKASSRWGPKVPLMIP
jgi:hypothetical protein